jgi:hypothetical protein
LPLKKEEEEEEEEDREWGVLAWSRSLSIERERKLGKMYWLDRTILFFFFFFFSLTGAKIVIFCSTNSRASVKLAPFWKI